MEICLHVPAGLLEASLYSLERVDGQIRKTRLGDSVPLDSALFQPGGSLHAGTIQQFMIGTAGQDNRFLDYGSDLWAAILPPKAAALWNEEHKKWRDEKDAWDQLPLERREATPTPVLRTYLSIENPLLTGIPWELLRGRHGEALFLDEATPWLRCRNPEMTPYTADLWPVRLFVINGANPEDRNAIHAEEEIRQIRWALRPYEHAFDVQVFDAAHQRDFTIVLLESEIKKFRPDILHFIGHSVSGRKPGLKVYNEKQDTYFDWTSSQIYGLLNGLPRLRLAYLNACRTQGRGTPAAVDSLSEVFLARSLAVIGLQADVRGKDAALCAAKFYAALASGQFVDAAIVAGRKQLRDNGEDTRAPYLPALTTSAPATDVLRVTQIDEQSMLATCLGPVRDHFVNQHPYRRQVFDAFFGNDESQMRRAILVQGDDGVGKSWLLRWCLHAFALHGHPVNYVEIMRPERRRPGPPDWLELVRLIRDGSSGPLSNGLPDAQRNRFNWELNYLSRGEPVPNYAGGDVADMAGSAQEILGAPKQRNDFRDRVCGALRRAMEEVAGKKTYFLVLDTWSTSDKGISETDFTTLKDLLLDPIAREKSSRVKIMLAFRSGDLTPYPTVRFPEVTWKPVAVPPFPASEVAELAKELVRLQNAGKDTTLAERSLLGIGQFPAMTAFDLYQFCKGFRPFVR